MLHRLENADQAAPTGGAMARSARVVDQYGQVIDVWLSTRRDLAAARMCLAAALDTGSAPVEVTTDRAPAYPRILDGLVPAALQITEQYAMRGIQTWWTAAWVRPSHTLKRKG